jgi:hypothetical protein
MNFIVMGFDSAGWLNVKKQSFNEVFQAYEAKTGKKLEITYIPIAELEERIAADPNDVSAYLHKMWATAEPIRGVDNHLYPDWNPSPVLDNIRIAWGTLDLFFRASKRVA